MPQVENGMLVSKDTTQFYNYLEFLDTTMESSSNDSIDNDVILQQIEDDLGFQSIRSIKHATFEAIDTGVGWATKEQAAQDETWVSKDIASLLNSNHDVKIGSYILHFVNKDIEIVVSADQNDILDQFHELDTSATVGDALNIDVDRKYSSVFDLGAGCSVGLGSVINRPTGTGPLTNTMRILKPIPYHPCDNPKSITFKYLKLQDMGSYRLPLIHGSFHINFGDGQSTDVQTPSLGFTVSDFYHTYSNYGNYIVTITAYPNGYAHNLYLQDTMHLAILNSSCGSSSRSKNSDWHYATISSNHWLAGQVSLNHISVGTFNREKSRIITETKLVKQKENNNYTRYRGDKSEQEVCNLKSITCGNTSKQLSGTKDGRKKTISMYKTKLGMFFYEKIESDHFHDNVSLHITLNACN